MNSFRRTRTGRVDPSWSKTVERAFGYAFQLGRKVRVVSVPHARGWMWRADVGEKLTNEQQQRAWLQHDLARERRRACPATGELAWHYGPTDTDPDRSKMWHTGCGGEVWTFDGGEICSKCEALGDGGRG